MKRLGTIFLALLFLFFVTKSVLASSANIQLFSASGCPHCSKEKAFLEKMKVKYPDLVVSDYEITHSKENYALFEKTIKDLNQEVRGVPFTIIGDKYFAGYQSDETTGKEMEMAIKKLVGITEPATTSPPVSMVNLPFLGETDIKKVSLPVLTVLIALLDGFNPCAMWTLLFLISLLLGLKDRKRIWLLGTAFIVSSALVYFLFLSAWLNLFLFLGLVSWVRLAIGLLALGAGLYYLYDYFCNKKGGCSVVGDPKRQKIFDWLKSVVQQKSLLVSFVGIVLLAFSVNLVELVCSAGLPAIYTKVLSLSNLNALEYYLYLLLYVFIFMVDDLIIFFTAMFTLRMIGIETKYSKISRLIGGILTLAIGLLLIFRPEALLF